MFTRSLYRRRLQGNTIPLFSGGKVSDSFNRADNALTLGTADTGQAWTALVGTWGISTNTAAVQVHVANDVAVVDAGKADVTVTVTLATIAADNGLVVRATDANNYIRVIFDSGTTWLIQKCVASSFTTIGSSAGTNANGDVLSVVTSGNAITAFKNGAQVATASDAFNVTATKHGLHALNITPRFDNFTIA